MTRYLSFFHRSLSALFLVSVILVFLPMPVQASGATFYISPPTSSFHVGDTVTSTIEINTGGQAINAAQATITFSSDKLTFDSALTRGTIFKFWTSGPTGGNSTITFSGGLSHPGYNGSSGKVLTINWKAKAAGKATIAFTDAKVLADDGAGTDVYGGSQGATYTIGVASPPPPTPKPTPSISAPIVSSSTHPDSSKWYANRNADVSWQAGGVSLYSFAFDQTPNTDPTNTPEAITKNTFTATSDGTWYVHVKGKTATGYTPTTHFRLQIDTTAPDTFSVSVKQDGNYVNPTPDVEFTATDATSGIAQYEASIDGGKSFAIKNNDTLPKQLPGHHTLKVTAIDNAGNRRDSEATFNITGILPPLITDWTHIVDLRHTITFLGQSQGDDTIHVYLDGREVDHFIANTKEVPSSKRLNRLFAIASDSNSAWQYNYTGLLRPGWHTFTFNRTDVTGAASPLTIGYGVRVVAQAIVIGPLLISATYMMYGLTAIIIGLLLIIIVSWLKKRRRQIGNNRQHEKMDNNPRHH